MSTASWRVDTVAAMASVIDNITGDPTSVVEHACSHDVVYTPGVAHLSGLQESVWRSDLAIYNAGHGSCSARLQFVPDDPAADRPFLDFDHLQPGRQHLFEDVVAYLAGGAEGKGYMRLWSDDGSPVPRLATRTYNLVEDGGTFGQFIPSFGGNELLWLGDRGILPGVASSSDAAVGSRTNLGVLNASDTEGVRLELVLHAVDGTIAGKRSDFDVAPGEFVQLSLAHALGLGGGENLAGTLEVRVTSGGRGAGRPGCTRRSSTTARRTRF